MRKISLRNKKMEKYDKNSKEYGKDFYGAIIKKNGMITFDFDKALEIAKKLQKEKEKNK